MQKGDSQDQQKKRRASKRRVVVEQDPRTDGAVRASQQRPLDAAPAAKPQFTMKPISDETSQRAAKKSKKTPFDYNELRKSSLPPSRGALKQRESRPAHTPDQIAGGDNACHNSAGDGACPGMVVSLFHTQVLNPGLSSSVVQDAQPSAALTPALREEAIPGSETTTAAESLLPSRTFYMLVPVTIRVPKNCTGCARSAEQTTDSGTPRTASAAGIISHRESCDPFPKFFDICTHDKHAAILQHLVL
ncbi:unnamed protein product [Phytophthora fragariaefolia]|uniref:Unnamed protein product n=1 Tax=Phytophthora fragariaefolia TaxID=1490495 RepID=A0A9W6TLI7_9STRA|nr:unnamed protein product [Phytophthora fragariaefolia]